MKQLIGTVASLSPRRNRWGEPVVIESGLGKAYDFLSPYRAKEIKNIPINNELERLSLSPDRGDAPIPRRIAKNTSFQGVRVSFRHFPDVYDEYVKLAGNDLKDPAFNMGAKDLLNEIVTGKHPLSFIYNLQSDSNKLHYISNEIAKYRKKAQWQIMNDPRFTDFQGHIEYKQQIARERRMPVLQ